RHRLAGLERRDAHLGVGIVGGVADVRVHDLARIGGRGDVDFEVEMVVGGAAGVADEGDGLARRHPLAYALEEPRVVVVDGEDGAFSVVRSQFSVVADGDRVGPGLGGTRIDNYAVADRVDRRAVGVV